MNKQKVLGALSLCRRAGKLAIGADAVDDALSKGAMLCVAASDAAERTVRNTDAEERGAELLRLELTMSELEAGTGRKFAVAAVTDENMAKLVITSAREGGCL